jgi:hypothetical protein
VVLAVATVARAAATVTFTADEHGTFPNTLAVDRQTQVLSVDLSAIPPDATIFRAELILAAPPRFGQPVFEPTTIYPVGRPDEKLRFAAPRCVGLDALDAVVEAVRAGRPLELKLETTLNGVERLEVSYLEGTPRAGPIPEVTRVRVTHRDGQSLVVFGEPKLADLPDFRTGEDVARFQARLAEKHPELTFRIWRAPVKITPETIARAELVGQCGPLSAWNDTYHQDATKKEPPVRYRVADLGEPLPWGTGVYAHHPQAEGRAYYAVSVAVAG